MGIAIYDRNNLKRAIFGSILPASYWFINATLVVKLSVILILRLKCIVLKKNIINVTVVKIKKNRIKT